MCGEGVVTYLATQSKLGFVRRKGGETVVQTEDTARGKARGQKRTRGTAGSLARERRGRA